MKGSDANNVMSMKFGRTDVKIVDGMDRRKVTNSVIAEGLLNLQKIYEDDNIATHL